jgi:excisionase family DNA binding protein
MSERLVDAAAIAELLGVPVGWVREQTRAGNLPHVTLGRYRRYSVPDVLTWVESLKSGGGPQFRRHLAADREV